MRTKEPNFWQEIVQIKTAGNTVYSQNFANYTTKSNVVETWRRCGYEGGVLYLQADKGVRHVTEWRAIKKLRN